MHWNCEQLNQYALIRAVARDGRSLRRIVKEAGISYNTGLKLTDPRYGKKYIRPYTLDKLCRVLDVPREELIL